jgi:Tfp pilus assembly protein PilV
MRMFDQITKRRKSDQGWALPELLAGMTVIIIVLVSAALVIVKVLSFQQDGESFDKGVQIARDYIEKSKQSSYSSLGFHKTDNGYRAKSADGTMNTVVTPDSKLTSGIMPLENVAIGGIEYTVRTDITWKDDTNFVNSVKVVAIDVSWVRENGKKDSTKISLERSPNASEQIPQALDLTVTPGSQGQPSAPSMYDTINQYGGYSSSLRTSYLVKVANQGDYPVSNVEFSIMCPSATVPVIVNYNAPPSGFEAQTRDSSYELSYYTRPSSLTCDVNQATTTVTAINTAGRSTPLTITPSNFVIY